MCIRDLRTLLLVINFVTLYILVGVNCYSLKHCGLSQSHSSYMHSNIELYYYKWGGGGSLHSPLAGA